jgi:putative transposase
LDACLTFFNFPVEQWVLLKTTTLKEFWRRKRPTEILTGAARCYRLLAFISLKIDLH